MMSAMSVQSRPVCSPRIVNPIEQMICLTSGSSACEYTGRGSSADVEDVEGTKLSVGRTLGRGAFAEVKAVYSHSTNCLMALKVVNKTVAPPEYLSEFLPRELQLLRALSHPHIIATHHIIETDKQVFILMDLAENGDLADYISSRTYLPEEEARYLFTQLLEGVGYLHSKCIAHRDIKCDNILLDHNMNIKIADFGLGIDVSSSSAKAVCGSPGFAAPEVLCRSTLCYDALKADTWSLGILLFVMVCGRLPLVYRNDKTGKIEVYFPFEIMLTHDLEDFVLTILRKEVSSRPTCQQMAKHPWMTSGTAEMPVQAEALKHTKNNVGIELCIQL